MLQRLHTFIRDISRSERRGSVRAETITEAINSASSSLWRSLVSKQKSGGGENYLLQTFKRSETVSTPYELSSGSGQEALTLESVLESTPNLLLADVGEYPVTNVSNDLNHIIEADFTATINSASLGIFDIPLDVFEIGDTFYHNYNGSRFEGQLLSSDSFIDRRNSTIIPCNEEQPIARLHDNKIEFYPIPTGADVYNFTVPHKKKNVIFRSERTLPNDRLKLTPTPKSFIDDIIIHYAIPPDLAVATYGAPVNGIQTVTATTDLNWSEGAFPEIALRALSYIGISTNNQMVAQAESLIEQNNSIDAQQ